MAVTALVGDLFAYSKRSHAYCRQFMVGTHRIQAHSSPRIGPDRLQYRLLTYTFKLLSRHAAQMIIYHSHRQALHASLTSPTHVQTERTHQLEVGCASGRDARRSECNGTSHSHLSVEHVICGGTRPQERAAALLARDRTCTQPAVPSRVGQISLTVSERGHQFKVQSWRAGW